MASKWMVAPATRPLICRGNQVSSQRVSSGVGRKNPWRLSGSVPVLWMVTLTALDRQRSGADRVGRWNLKDSRPPTGRQPPHTGGGLVTSGSSSGTQFVEKSTGMSAHDSGRSQPASCTQFTGCNVTESQSTITVDPGRNAYGLAAVISHDTRYMVAC